ncbi:MAG: hypothetical protein ABIK39_00500 [candidate division WOR-3 bacterium]
MACFLVPAAAGIATTALKKKFPAEFHPEWLNSMLWGGVAMLAVEHFSHGEVVPYPPFLTAMKNPSEVSVMLKEMLTVGGTMTLAIFAVWLILVAVSKKMPGKSKVTVKTDGG